MRKTISMLMAVLVAFSLVACGGKSEPAEPVKEASQETAAEPEEKEEEPEKETEEEVTETEASETEVEEEQEDSSEEGTSVVEEQVLFDDESLVLTASKLLIDKNTGHVLIDLTLENNRKEKVMMTADKVLVNGTEVNGAAYVSADAGETGGGNVAIYGDSLEEKGIDTLETVEFEMSAINNETYENLLNTGKLVIEVTNGGAPAPKDDKASDSEAQAEENGEGTTYKYFGVFADNLYVETPNQKMASWYVTLNDDGSGYLYFGDENKGDITGWKGEGDDFTLEAGISKFEGNSYRKGDVLRLDFDEFTLVFLANGVTGEDIDAISAEEFKKTHK